MKDRNKFKRIVDRLKGRDLKIEDAMLFKEPEYFTFFNESVKEIEIRRNKKFSKKEYNELIYIFSKDEKFNNNCKIYLDDKNSFSKPRMTFIKKNSEKALEKYQVRNLKASDLKKKIEKKKNIFSDYYRMHQSLKKSPGFDFLKKFSDIDKLRLIINEIKERGNRKNFNLTIEEERAIIEFFYKDTKLNHFYKLYKKTGNKLYKPTLNYKTPLSKGGENKIENIQFISKLENLTKGDMDMLEWSETKKNFKSFFS